jgi:hypothetical protein
MWDVDRGGALDFAAAHIEATGKAGSPTTED